MVAGTVTCFDVEYLLMEYDPDGGSDDLDKRGFELMVSLVERSKDFYNNTDHCTMNGSVTRTVLAGFLLDLLCSRTFKVPFVVAQSALIWLFMFEIFDNLALLSVTSKFEKCFFYR